MSRRFFADVSPLRESRDYRLLFAGQLVSFMGRQLTVVERPVGGLVVAQRALQVRGAHRAEIADAAAGRPDAQAQVEVLGIEAPEQASTSWSVEGSSQDIV